MTSYDINFARLADNFFAAYFEFRPVKGTITGLHEYDAELGSYFRSDFENEKERLRSFEKRLLTIDRNRLSRGTLVDYAILENLIKGNLLDIENLRYWEKDPNYYNSIVTEGVFSLIRRNFAPIQERLNKTIRREKQVERVLRAARENLRNPPKIYTEIAIEQFTGAIDFFSHDLPRFFKDVKDKTLLSEFEEVNSKVIEEIGSFVEYLKAELLPNSNGDYAIGSDNYEKKLLYDEMVDIPLPQLIEIGERELKRTHEELGRVARIIDPSRDPSGIIKELSKEHPSSEELISYTSSLLEDIRAYCIEHNIITIPSEERCKVQETPSFARKLLFALEDTPGPFEKVATEAYFYVTKPDPNWPPEKQEEHLRFFNRYLLTLVSVHEAYPGHYTQFLFAKDVESNIRRIVTAYSFFEGFGHYTEQMMLDEGFGSNDPKLRLFQLQAALQRICRYLVGIKMHTEIMSLQEGIEFFISNAYMERVNAEREAIRGTIDAMYLAYTLGKLQILELREEYKKLKGNSYSLKEFHDNLLSYGYPPVRILRMIMLPGDKDNGS